MVNFTGTTKTRLKVQVIGPATTYTYNLNVGEWTTFPLSDGNGDYTVSVLENTTGSSMLFTAGAPARATASSSISTSPRATWST